MMTLMRFLGITPATSSKEFKGVNRTTPKTPVKNSNKVRSNFIENAHYFGIIVKVVFRNHRQKGKANSCDYFKQ